jgi:hypothetical protein
LSTFARVTLAIISSLKFTDTNTLLSLHIIVLKMWTAHAGFRSLIPVVWEVAGDAGSRVIDVGSG